MLKALGQAAQGLVQIAARFTERRETVGDVLAGCNGSLSQLLDHFKRVGAWSLAPINLRSQRTGE